MRAHFAGDVVSGTSDDLLESNRNEAQSLKARIEDFKQDTRNMEILNEFIDDVLQKAQIEAENQQPKKVAIKNGKGSQQPKEKSRQSFVMPDFKNGKVVNRARGLVVRIFDAICNCANTAAAAPAQRLKLRGKRSASTANGGGNGGGGSVGGGGGGLVGTHDGGNRQQADGAEDAAKEKQKKQGDGGSVGVKDKKIKEDIQTKQALEGE